MTDVFTKELVRQATEEGFAVAVIDAFSELGVSSADKTRFPNATRYAVHLREAIRSDSRFDQSRIYYTGFSYGGHSVMNVLHDRIAHFKAIAPVEAGCQIQPAGRLVPYGVLFVLGDRSHYPPKPCLYLQQALHTRGVDARPWWDTQVTTLQKCPRRCATWFNSFSSKNSFAYIFNYDDHSTRRRMSEGALW